MFTVTIKDCEVQTFRSGGKGGQNQNKVESGVRVVHKASGAVGEARDSRDQPRNKQAAFSRMANSAKFQRWARERAQEIIEGKSIEQAVDEAMVEDNLRIEIRNEQGKWVCTTP